MEINYIIKKSYRRSISVKVNSDQTVLVKAPVGTPASTVEEFLLSKKQWIIRQLEKVAMENQKVAELGCFTPEELKQIHKKAKELIPQRVSYYARLGNITYNQIFIRLQKTRWGSCSVDGNLNFNCLLVLMPIEVLDSVVVHELCHCHHMDHSKAFYDEVLSLYPDYKKWNKWLKQNGSVYLIRACKK